MSQLLLRLRPLGKQEGYTLPELLTVMAILGIVLGALGQLFVQASNSEVEQNRRFQAQTEARLALDKVRREAHCASAVSPAGTSASVTLTLPAGCPTLPAGGSVTWCTQGSGSRFGLYRVPPPGGACSTGTKYADYLKNPLGNVFSYAVQTGSLAKLSVDFWVDVDPADTLRGYRLQDDIVLRNSPRA
jgi:prepilin-type N-terminal cleavage/methylation domain-containing protein